MTRGLLLFGLFAAAAVSAEPAVLGSAVQGSAALTDADRDRVARAVLLAETLVRAERLALTRGRRTTSVGPLAPDEACGYCGTATEVAEASLLAQGIPRERLFQVDSNDLVEGAYQHVALAYRTVGRAGEPLTVIIDPTFSQVESYSYQEGDTAYFRGGRTPGDGLARDPVGRPLLDQLRTEGFWIPSEASFQAWQRALGRNPDTGTPGRPLQTWAAFTARTGASGRTQLEEDVAAFLFLRGFRNATRANVLEILRGELARLTGEQLEERRRIGASFPLDRFPCGTAFLDIARGA